jgi:hypothetical protein
MTTTTGTFADDTFILTSHEDPVAAARRLQSHVDQLEAWLKKWRININETKFMQVTFTVKKGKCPAVYLNNTALPQSSTVKSWVPFGFQAYMETAYCQKKKANRLKSKRLILDHRT